MPLDHTPALLKSWFVPQPRQKASFSDLREGDRTRPPCSVHTSATSSDLVSRGMERVKQSCSALCLSLQAAELVVNRQDLSLFPPSHFVLKQVGGRDTY